MKRSILVLLLITLTLLMSTGCSQSCSPAQAKAAYDELSDIEQSITLSWEITLQGAPNPDDNPEYLSRTAISNRMFLRLAEEAHVPSCASNAKDSLIAYIEQILAVNDSLAQGTDPDDLASEFAAIEDLRGEYLDHLAELSAYLDN